MQKYVYGIDLGGTTAKIGLLDTDGKLLEKWSVPTDIEHGSNKITSDLVAAIKSHMERSDLTPNQITGIGIAVPGAVRSNGYLDPCSNLNGWGGFKVADVFSPLLFDLPVAALNDANAASLGEYWVGGGSEYDSLLMITLGTGIGGGIGINGKSLIGANGAAGEIGHIKVNPNETEVCGCGKRGCLEQYCSATGIVRMMKKRLASDSRPSSLRDMKYTAKDIFDAAKDGDATAVAVVDDISEILGRTIAGVIATVDPEVILLGGGVSLAGDYLSTRVQANVDRYAFPSCEGTPVKPSTLGNDAGIYGAACMALQLSALLNQ